MIRPQCKVCDAIKVHHGSIVVSINEKKKKLYRQCCCRLLQKNLYQVTFEGLLKVFCKITQQWRQQQQLWPHTGHQGPMKLGHPQDGHSAASEGRADNCDIKDGTEKERMKRLTTREN